ncbi:hypothetical protein LTR24_000851 [Lithohypha guttulata]|uniref:Uncharacterized protein n=1 Tax=Lithohypha guttulata TaxID=1690604 RepID=A0ABR0KM98_9EURO|nr:hypothetical protein LTR24_000851 [Lithohypha guttulata]
MFTAFDQENLTHAHHTTAANKPLNQNVRALQPKTPGAVSKTPFRARNDENAPLNTGKAAKNAFVTPGPAPQTTKRAPLGAKTTNAKGGAFQTPAPGQKLRQTDQTANKPSSTARRSTKKKIYVEPEPVTEPAAPEAGGEEDDEPDFGYAPPPIVPLPDPPLDFEGVTYEALRPENFNRGVRDIYFHSPKDENGFSIALKKQEELQKKSLEDDLARTLEEPKRLDPDEEVRAMIRAGPKRTKPVPESKINTIKARSASAALSHSTAPRTHQKLPSAATRETAASKQRRKAAFVVSRDENAATSTMLKPISRGTIGFPKAKKPTSILPQGEQKRSHERPGSRATARRAQKEEDDQTTNQSTISPRKFVQLYGEPPVESDMWFRLMELEIKDRHRGENEEVEAGIFDFELDDDLDQRLGVHFDGQDVDDFELTS